MKLTPGATASWDDFEFLSGGRIFSVARKWIRMDGYELTSLCEPGFYAARSDPIIETLLHAAEGPGSAGQKTQVSYYRRGINQLPGKVFASKGGSHPVWRAEIIVTPLRPGGPSDFPSGGTTSTGQSGFRCIRAAGLNHS